MYKGVVDKITDRNQLPFLGLVRRRRINKLKRKYAIVRAFRTDYLNDLFKSELEIEAAVNRDRVNVLIQVLSSINPFGRSKRKRRIPQLGNS